MVRSATPLRQQTEASPTPVNTVTMIMQTATVTVLRIGKNCSAPSVGSPTLRLLTAMATVQMISMKSLAIRIQTSRVQICLMMTKMG